MNFEFGMKGFTFSMIALICWGIGFLLIMFNVKGILISILSIAILVLAILAFINGKKEFEVDPTNVKAKAGGIIGLSIFIITIV